MSGNEAGIELRFWAEIVIRRLADIGALELSEKKGVLAVQLPGVKRHSRHVVEARTWAEGVGASATTRLLTTADTSSRNATILSAASGARGTIRPCDGATDPEQRA